MTIHIQSWLHDDRPYNRPEKATAEQIKDSDEKSFEEYIKARNPCQTCDD